MEAREIAARVLTDVISNKKNLDHCLEKHIDTYIDSKTKSLTQEICYGVMRWYFQLEFIVNSLIPKPLKDKDKDLFVLLLCGVYQIKYLRTPDYAAINESVGITKSIGKPWASKLVNAVLRRYQREREAIDKIILKSNNIYYASPVWFAEKLSSQYPEDWKDILDASNQYPPMHIRLNLEKYSRQNYLDILDSSGINAQASKLSNAGVLLAESKKVEDVPGFMEGYVSVQDFGAQLAAPLLDCKAGHRVLDACAAPGGKSCHILESYPDISELVAIDIESSRISLLNDNLKRTNKVATVIQANVSDIKSWWDDVPFDRILLDVPCSATGIIRRHPDIKYLRSPEQITALVSTQMNMLEALWPILKLGGKLLYCTCSLFKEESDEQIDHFINIYNDVKLLPIKDNWGVYSTYGRQTIPGRDEADGFFYSILEKT